MISESQADITYLKRMQADEILEGVTFYNLDLIAIQCKIFKLVKLFKVFLRYFRNRSVCDSVNFQYRKPFMNQNRQKLDVLLLSDDQEFNRCVVCVSHKCIIRSIDVRVEF